MDDGLFMQDYFPPVRQGQRGENTKENKNIQHSKITRRGTKLTYT